MALVTNSSTINKSLCARCVQLAKWVPVCFIAAIIAWSYYAYVVELCINFVSSTPQRVFYLFFYHVIACLFLWTYRQTVCTDVRGVPLKFKISVNDWDVLRESSEEDRRRILESFAENLPVTMRSLNGCVRVCEKCRIVKPDRSHHCSVCGECVLKMDHHCVWVNNCVGYANYKFFVLFLGYALLYCIYVSLTTLPAFILFWQGKLDKMGRFHILFLFFISAMFAISLVSLFCYHIYLVLKNRTTLEAFRSPNFRMGIDKNAYNIGKLGNFQEVFGRNPKTWFLPIFTSLGDGVSYPMQCLHTQYLQTVSYQSMDNTNLSPGDGYTFPERQFLGDSERLLGSDQYKWDEEADY